MIDLSPGQLCEVRRILADLAPDCEVLAFGSRVEGRASRNSDLDLLLTGPDEMDWRRLEHLKDAFAESDLPFMVDVVDGRSVDPGFRTIILRASEVVQSPGIPPLSAGQTG